MSEDKKEFKQAYLEEKLQAIADKLGEIISYLFSFFCTFATFFA